MSYQDGWILAKFLATAGLLQHLFSLHLWIIIQSRKTENPKLSKDLVLQSQTLSRLAFFAPFPSITVQV